MTKGLAGMLKGYGFPRVLKGFGRRREAREAKNWISCS